MRAETKSKRRKKKVKEAEKHEIIDDSEFPFPLAEPCARVGVSLGYKTTKNYQAVDVHVSVEIPCYPGRIDDGLQYCRDKADAFLAENAEYVNEAIESLAEED